MVEAVLPWRRDLLQHAHALILDRSGSDVAYDSFDGVKHNTSKKLTSL